MIISLNFEHLKHKPTGLVAEKFHKHNRKQTKRLRKKKLFLSYIFSTAKQTKSRSESRVSRMKREIEVKQFFFCFFKLRKQKNWEEKWRTGTYLGGIGIELKIRSLSLSLSLCESNCKSVWIEGILGLGLVWWTEAEAEAEAERLSRGFKAKPTGKWERKGKPSADWRR